MTSPDPIDTLLSSASELVNSPGLAADSIQAGGDPAANGQALSHAATVATIQQHAQKGGGGLLGAIGGFFKNDIAAPVGDAASFAMQALNKPIAAVQHEYRYFHAVWEKHGAGAAFGALIPSVVGGTIGGAIGTLTDEVTGPAGTVTGAKLGAEGAGYVASALGGPGQYQDLWKATASGNYRDSAGHLVNPGQDLADLVDNVLNGHNYTPNKGFDLGTGIGNAVFDLSLDPLMVGGKLAESSKVARLGVDTAKGSKDLEGIAKTTQAVQDARAAGLTAADVTVAPDRVMELYSNQPRVAQMVNQLAGMSSEQILNEIPKLRPLAGPLGAAQTPEDVMQVYRDALQAKNGTVLARGLPTTSITRVPIALAKARQAILNFGSQDAFELEKNDAGQIVPKLDADGNKIPLFLKDASGNMLLDASGNPRVVQTANPLIRAATTYRAFNISDDLTKFSSKEANPTEDGFADTLYSVAKQSMNARSANAYRAQFLATNSATERLNLVTNAFTDTLRSVGLPDDHPAVLKFRGDLQKMIDAGANSPTYALDRNGEKVVIPKPTDDNPDGVANTGVFLNQTGKIHLPNYQEIRGIQRDLRDTNIFGKTINAFGHADDWINQHYTTRIFKSLALLSLGFATRVASGELIPAIIQNGSIISRGALGLAMDKLNPELNGFLRDNAGTLIGKSATTADDVTGKISSIASDGSSVDIARPDGTVTTHQPSELTLNHDEVNEYALRKLAKEQGFDFDGGDFKHLVASTRYSLYGSLKPLVDPQVLESHQLTQMNLGGHKIVGPLAADHGEDRILSSQAAVQQALIKRSQQLGIKNGVLGKKFTIYDGADERHPMFWNHALNEAAKDPAFVQGAAAYKDALDAGLSSDEAVQRFMTNDSQAMLEDGRYKNQLLGAEDINAFTAARSKALEGLVYGPDGTLHSNVLADLAEGNATSMTKLGATDVESRPAVKGREIDPAPLPDNGSLLNTLVQGGYKRLIDPIINNLSRKPIFNALVADEYKKLYGYVDAGLMSKADANMVAIQRAVPKMMPLVHNTEFRSQFSELARNFMPFYFAQEQAFKRYGRAALTDTVSFERARLAQHGLANSGIIQQDNAGQKHVVLPVIGNAGTWITKGAGLFGIGLDGGLPSDISGQVSSLKSVVPETQLGMSPLVSAPLRQIENVFPSTEPGIAKIIGPIAQNESMTSMLIPNSTLKTVLEGTALSDQSKAFHSAFLYGIQNAARRADELRAQAADPSLSPEQAQRLKDEATRYMPDPSDPDPHHRQEAIDRIKASTRITFLVKAGFNMLSPLAPSVDVGDVKLRKEFEDTIKANNGDIALATQAFLDKHPLATADTVFQSDNHYTNNSVPSGKAALDFVQQNRQFIESHPLAAAYLVPQDNTGTNLEAYNQEVAVGLRQRRTPEQFVDALYAASTNARYYPLLAQKNQAVQNASDPYTKQQINSAFAKLKNDLGAANPVWYSQITDPQAAQTAHYALADLRATLGKNAPDSPQAATIAGLINDYDQFAAREALLKSQGQSTSSLNNMWDNYLTGRAANDPAATAVINGVFRRLPKYEYAVNA